jgi:hypothetical protein
MPVRQTVGLRQRWPLWADHYPTKWMTEVGCSQSTGTGMTTRREGKDERPERERGQLGRRGSGEHPGADGTVGKTSNPPI